MATKTESKTFYPSGYEGSTFASITDEANAVGKGTSNSVYAVLNLTTTKNKAHEAFWTFDCSVIPADAVIDSVSCKVKIKFSSTTAIGNGYLQLYAGSTSKGSQTSARSSSASTYTLSVGTWTRAELSNCRLRTYASRNTNTSATAMHFYGADLTVTYTYQNQKFMLKTGGSWAGAARVFKKVSGIWVEQEELANVVPENVKYVNGGEYVPPKKTVALTGVFNETRGYVTIDGTKYTSAATVQVKKGAVVDITIGSIMYPLKSKVLVDGVEVYNIGNTSTPGTYSHIVDTDCTITMCDHGTGYYAEIVTT